jgi:S-(hydroxymethyl)glutathione dehydrogenase/alcohol dehydrogenase
MKKERTMKAAICYEYGKPLVIEEVTLEPPGKGEVTIRIAATAVCHSDVHCIKGEHGPCPLPALAGHETAGYVEEVGEGVTYVKPGDLVVYTVVPVGCGHCYYCTMGFPDQCENNKVAHWASGNPATFQYPGKVVNKHGQRLSLFYGTMGTFAEYATGLEINLVKIPQDMPVDRASLLSCGVISGFGAVVNRAKVEPNRSVLVMGAGGVGLNAIQGAVFCGAYPIIAIDIDDSKLEMAKKFGATYTINAKKESDPTKKVREFTYGRGADYVIIAAAGIDILRQGFLMSAQAGMTVVVGHGFGEQLSDWMPIEFCMGRTLTGSAMGAERSRFDIPRLIELYKSKRLKLDELVSGHYSFDQINEAIASHEKGGVIRNVIMF